MSDASTGTPSRKRGTLRVYLGAAPGVGKTFAMLNEGRRRHARGTDVVVGFVETHGRARTEEQIGDLEVVPRRKVPYRDTTFEEMDVEAILARMPQVVLVDELAHTNIPGSRNPKRCQDVGQILDAGIDVISTVNIQHLESLNDVVERITGIAQRETIPDDIVRAADQVELVDSTPEALRRRMAHGNIYAPEKVDAALANYFRSGNLGALRELALLWVADQVDVALEDYRERHGITQPWETRERVVVAVTGAPGTEALIRRGARIAQRAHGELLGVHVRNDDGLAGPRSAVLDGHRALLTEVGGEYHEVVGSDPGVALVAFAKAENATQIVLGASRRSRWVELVRGSVINKVIRLSQPIDVHVISHEPTEGEQVLPPQRTALVRMSALPARRQWTALWFAALAVPLLTFVLTRLRDSVSLSSVLLLYLFVVVTTAAIGGALPALATAIVGFLCANYYFTPPLHGFTISEGENLLALIVFVVVGGIVSVFVDVAARRSLDARRSRAEAETLARLAGTMGEADPLRVLLGHLRTTFGLHAAAILRRVGTAWEVEAVAGSPVPQRPEDGDTVEALSPELVLTLVGQQLAADDLRVLHAFTAQLSVAVERSRLHAEAARSLVLSQGNELRTALLQAVSHDLRTPLASIKASASSLRQQDIAWSSDEREQFLATIEEETDRLTTLVANLLDMSRVQAGALAPATRSVGLEEVVPAALASLGPAAIQVETDVPESLPEVLADPALLERVIANLVGNALAWSPSGVAVRVEGGAVGSRVDLRVIDRGPGIPVRDRERVLQPFQRLGDQPSVNGVGLGLAVANGFVHAMGGDFVLEDTPGGGTTAVVSLPVAR